jgi:hypothetical protein
MVAIRIVNNLSPVLNDVKLFRAQNSQRLKTAKKRAGPVQTIDSAFNIWPSPASFFA